MNSEPNHSCRRRRPEKTPHCFSAHVIGLAWTRSRVCWPMAAAGLMALMFAAQVSAAQSVFPATAVGTAAAQQAVIVVARAAGTVDHETFVTLGQPNLDFTLPLIPASSCTGITLTVGGATPSCTQSVTFNPATPGVRIGAVELFDAGGDLLGETLVSGSGVGGLAVLVPGNTLPFAGNGNHLDPVQDGIPALTAELDSPTSVAIDGAGNVYIADSEHNRIRLASAATGLISTFAGTGTASYTGDNAAATAGTRRASSTCWRSLNRRLRSRAPRSRRHDRGRRRDGP